MCWAFFDNISARDLISSLSSSIQQRINLLWIHGKINQVTFIVKHDILIELVSNRKEWVSCNKIGESFDDDENRLPLRCWSFACNWRHVCFFFRKFRFYDLPCFPASLQECFYLTSQLPLWWFQTYFSCFWYEKKGDMFKHLVQIVHLIDLFLSCRSKHFSFIAV